MPCLLRRRARHGASRKGRPPCAAFRQCEVHIHVQKGEFQPAAKHPTCGSLDLCLIADGSIEDIQREFEAKGAPIELGIVERTGARGRIDSIYLRDPDGNLVEISVYSQG